ncbi:hypothetical protein NGM99_05370 [Mesorhizobium sp. RP14(2022)]|uniref:Uncharacterized protein n=1 Tax=Mesorhizobium liriopis TaxID=2953882 RepID=A0ABT1C315_9HYPH|nr:hypothetical protein [Mesorhizobium liriopis]MCO6049219.1 hypothetical protein [Mesorhizobium liriopis]
MRDLFWLAHRQMARSFEGNGGPAKRHHRRKRWSKRHDKGRNRIEIMVNRRKDWHRIITSIGYHQPDPPARG